MCRFDLGSRYGAISLPVLPDTDTKHHPSDPSCHTRRPLRIV